MKFISSQGGLSYLEYLQLKEDERQELIKKYEAEGYTKPWAIIKADFDIEEQRQARIKELLPLAEMRPLD